MGMLVLLMAVGFAAAKANWVGDGFNQATSRLVANVFLPASILSSVIGVAPLFSGKELAVVIAGTFVLFGLCAVGGLVVSKVVPMPKQDQLVAWLSIFFMNNVFVGFPVVQAIFGEEALFCASLTNIPFNILLFSIGVSRLRAGQGQGRVTIREVFSPGLIATLVAVVVFLFQIPVPSLLGDTIKSLANGTVPLSMIIIGVSLSHVPILDAFKDWKAYLVSLGRLVLCPILTYFVLGLFLEGTTLGRHRRLPQRRHDHDPEPALRHRRYLRLPRKLPQHHPLRRHPAHHDLLPAVSAAGKTTRTEDLPCFSLRNTSA